MKKCPNCGASIDANAKFCTNCGYSFVAAKQQSNNANQQPNANNQQTTQNNSNNQQINQNVENVKKYSRGYFSWLLSTLKHPSNIINSDSDYYGITSFIISAILIAFSISNITRKIMSLSGSSDDTMDSLKNSMGGSNPFAGKVLDGIQFGFIKSFILIIILFIAWIAIGFGTKKLVNKNQFTFLNYINETAGTTNYILVADIILVLISFMISGNLSSITSSNIASDSMAAIGLGIHFFIYAVVMVFIVPTLYNIGSLITIFKGSDSKFDRLYAFIIAVVVDIFIAYEIINLF